MARMHGNWQMLANRGFAADDVWPGSQRVELSYDRTSVVIGGSITLGTATLLALLMVLGERRPR
jgi:hypothetical protein